MSDIEIAGLTVAVLLRALLVVAGIIITVSPFFCWRYLKKIKEQQAAEARYIDTQLVAMHRSLDNIGATLLHIAKTLDEKCCPNEPKG